MKSVVAVVVACLAASQVPAAPPEVLPATAVASLQESLEAAQPNRHHLWRDTPPRAGRDVVNAYIEIPSGELKKWEFDMAKNARRVDRVMPPDLGGYPVNYGFVPQTVSYDGDPFDALVLGPPLTGGRIVRGVVVGLMLMEDEKGIDSKVVLSPIDRNGKATYALTEADRQRIGDYFNRYKRHEPGKYSSVPGWGSPADGLAHVEVAHAFFRECRSISKAPCRTGVR